MPCVAEVVNMSLKADCTDFNFENGGLKDIDIECELKALRFSWIKRLIDSKFHPWETLAAKLLEPVVGIKIFPFELVYVLGVS